MGQTRWRPHGARELLSWPSGDPVALDVRLRDVRCRADATTEIRGVHFEVFAGERVALTGAAAAPARTAVLRAVAGLHQVSGGQITVGGPENRNPAERAWRSRACAWLPRVTLAPGSMARAGTMPGRGAEITRGELQFLYMARAIGCVTKGAGVLLADHPTEGLEGADRNALARLFAESPVTVLVATDDPVLVSLCDRSVDLAPAVRHDGGRPDVGAVPRGERRRQFPQGRGTLTESRGNSLGLLSDY